MSTIQETLFAAINQLKRSNDLFETARIDAEVLLAHVLHQSRTYLYTHSDAHITNTQHAQFLECIQKRQTGTPIAYITGSRGFWTLTLEVNENVLIPRPETELLVELALAGEKALSIFSKDVSSEIVGPEPNLQQLWSDHCRLGPGPTSSKPNKADFESPSFASLKKPSTLREKGIHILDLGTGSGAIALAIASEKPHWQVTAVDICAEALSVARRNAQRLQINNITFLQSRWFENLPRQNLFDIIIANPPYIAADDPHLSQGDVRFEPQKALIADQNGLSDIFHIIQASLARLTPNGLLLIEHGNVQHEAVKACFETCGYQTIIQHCDLQNHIRVTSGFSCQT